jgi:hypothetical protein
MLRLRKVQDQDREGARRRGVGQLPCPSFRGRKVAETVEFVPKTDRNVYRFCQFRVSYPRQMSAVLGYVGLLNDLDVVPSIEKYDTYLTSKELPTSKRL